MSIQGLSNPSGPAEHRPAAAPARAVGVSSFRDQLVRTAAVEDSIHLRMPCENTVYSGAHGGKNGTFQEIYAEYTADSAPEDPIVHVTGTSDSGPYAFTCHVRDIDPANASYAELAVLYGHLVKSGAYQSDSGGVLPTGLDSGDVTERRDYLSAIGRHRNDRHFGGACAAQAEELLALYQPYAFQGAARAAVPSTADFLRKELLDGLDEAQLLLLRRNQEGREWKKEQEEWDRLMKGLDSWIDALRNAAEREREGRSGGVTEEGGQALMALYRGYIAAAAQAEGAGLDPEISRKDLLSALTAAQSELLERLKEERAAEEEREDWVELLRRLDRWIEALRGAEDREEDGRPAAVSAAQAAEE